MNDITRTNNPVINGSSISLAQTNASQYPIISNSLVKYDGMTTSTYASYPVQLDLARHLHQQHQQQSQQHHQQHQSADFFSNPRQYQQLLEYQARLRRQMALQTGYHLMTGYASRPQHAALMSRYSGVTAALARNSLAGLPSDMKNLLTYFYASKSPYHGVSLGQSQNSVNFHCPPEDPKPSHSYIGIIAMAILNSKDKKLVLSDIYQWILDNYPYFRRRGPGWRNSIRHNLSLNDCFVKSGRSANGKGHYWAVHPANVEDFKRGDFRRRRAQRKVRKAMGLSVPDDEDSPSPSPTPVKPHDLFCGFDNKEWKKNFTNFNAHSDLAEELSKASEEFSAHVSANKESSPEVVGLTDFDRSSNGEQKPSILKNENPQTQHRQQVLQHRQQLFQHQQQILQQQQQQQLEQSERQGRALKMPNMKKRLFDVESLLAPDPVKPKVSATQKLYRNWFIETQETLPVASSSSPLAIGRDSVKKSSQADASLKYLQSLVIDRQHSTQDDQDTSSGKLLLYCKSETSNSPLDKLSPDCVDGAKIGTNGSSLQQSELPQLENNDVDDANEDVQPEHETSAEEQPLLSIVKSTTAVEYEYFKSKLPAGTKTTEYLLHLDVSSFEVGAEQQRLKRCSVFHHFPASVARFLADSHDDDDDDIESDKINGAK